jgi:ATP-dependent helicase HrpB
VTPLPIDPSLPRIVDALRAARSAVIVAPPGAGKTTRVPVAMLRAGLLDKEHPNLVMLQPRRVAARAAAARIADENGWQLGREVGYHVRFDRKITRDTRLRVLTEGILTRQLLEDPYLQGVGAVLLDEFHERSLNTDLAVALLREVQQTVRDDLKIVVMSATLEAEPVARFLGDCPVLRTQGRAYPIDIEYIPVVRGDEEVGAISTVEKFVTASPTPARDILIFLPGAEEIRRVIRNLEPLAARENLALLPIHGSLTADEQDRALRPDSQGRRKIIAATNIAETSLTIEGVGVVIDTGLARVAGYDPQRGLDRLEVRRISKASATQRTGRAGRTGPGACARLWSEREWERMPDFELPEVKRVDLASTVLELHAWGKPDPRAFAWYEPPDAPTLAAAESLLAMLGAIGPDGRITDVGRALAKLPVHPRLGRLMLAAADAGLVRHGALLAALISEKDILRPQQHDRTSLSAGSHRTIGNSDLLLRVHRLGENARDERLDRNAVRQVLRVKDELQRLGERIAPGQSRLRHAQPEGMFGPPGDEALLRLILWAYPDRVARRRGKQDTAVMVGGGGGGVKLSPESVLHASAHEFFVAIDPRQDERSTAREAFVRIASAIDVGWLEEMFPHQVRREKVVTFDEQRQKVVGLSRLWYRDLLLREDKDAPVDAAQAADAIADVLRVRAGEIFRADDAAQSVLYRVSLLREKMPENPWPHWDDAQLGDLLATGATHVRSLEDARRLPLASILKSGLPYPLDRLLDKEAPESIQVPTGNRIRLRYSPTEAVLAVRLQELFGLLDTPRIAAGRQPVKLELLAPNYRPVQVTTDLRSFWTSTYFQVRKDLKARYPKHAWPEDPLTAKPEAKGGRGRKG